MKFVMACGIGQINLAKTLLDSNVVQNHQNYSTAFKYAFENACANEHLDIVKLLLPYCSDANVGLITTQLAIAIDHRLKEPQLKLAEVLVGSDILRDAKQAIEEMLIEILENPGCIQFYFSLKNRPFLISYYIVGRIFNYALYNGYDCYDRSRVKFFLTFDEVYRSDPTDLGYEKLIEVYGRVPLIRGDLQYAIKFWIDRGRMDIVDVLRTVPESVFS
ncbi:hypothetical protein HDU76_011301 [Blyttiomyces sp. JEL0837]|nr:hypothetical protein HDU76_011301 [Blyttiomyces sp. JEL0837]